MERALETLISWWELSGVDVPDIKPAARQAKPPVRRSQSEPAAPAAAKPALTMSDPPRPENSDISQKVAKAKTLDALRQLISELDVGEISDHARQSVFARGNPEADIMVIGEAPGRDEDIQGKPFVGKSGQLLDRIFASIGLNEDTLYITNVINWRPPGNRNPTAEEIALCLPIIHKHIELIAPKIIVLVGGVSFSALTGQTGIMKNRGQWVSLEIKGQNIPTLPIYHPAFLLRQPALKKDVWHDMLSLRQKNLELVSSS